MQHYGFAFYQRDIGVILVEATRAGQMCSIDKRVLRTSLGAVDFFFFFVNGSSVSRLGETPLRSHERARAFRRRRLVSCSHGKRGGFIQTASSSSPRFLFHSWKKKERKKKPLVFFSPWRSTTWRGRLFFIFFKAFNWEHIYRDTERYFRLARIERKQHSNPGEPIAWRKCDVKLHWDFAVSEAHVFHLVSNAPIITAVIVEAVAASLRFIHN